jgi:hypothetical protein
MGPQSGDHALPSDAREPELPRFLWETLRQCSGTRTAGRTNLRAAPQRKACAHAVVFSSTVERPPVVQANLASRLAHGMRQAVHP